MSLRRRLLAPLALGILLASALPMVATGQANLPCPFCEPEETETSITMGNLVDQVLWTLLHRGVSLLLVGAMALVTLPWLIAGGAILVSYLPQVLRAPPT